VGKVAQFVREVVREPEIRRDVAKQGHGNAVSIPVWERCLARAGPEQHHMWPLRRCVGNLLGGRDLSRVWVPEIQIRVPAI
jgi:hypothetical protein